MLNDGLQTSFEQSGLIEQFGRNGFTGLTVFGLLIS
jgi:hypothetical protein